MKGKLYGVGVGPGDPELLTIKAVNAIKKCGIIAVPDSGSGEQVALTICSDYLADKKIIYCNTPMTKDEDKLFKNYEKNADTLSDSLERGLDVAFLTLGDPTVYSTYIYIHKIVMQRGYEVEIIPGVTSFCAAAAGLNISLCEKKQALHILPATYEGSGELLKLSGTKVFMKSGKKLTKLLANLEQNNLLSKSYLVERCGLENEKKIADLTGFKEESSYFTLVITKGDEV